MSNDIERAWDVFRNIVSLAQGAEWYAAEAERAACCAAMPGIERSEGNGHNDAMREAAFRHADTAMHYAIATGAYLVRLKAMVDEPGSGHTANHLQNAKHHIEKAMKAERCAKEAVEALTEHIGGRPFANPVCQMTNL